VKVALRSRIIFLWLIVSFLSAYSSQGWSQTGWPTTNSVPANKYGAPLDAIVAGYEADGTPLYACRVYHYSPGNPYEIIASACRRLYRQGGAR
jgi:hypothetical protein